MASKDFEIAEVLVELMCEFHAESGYDLDILWAGESFLTLLSNPVLGCAWLVERNGRLAGYIVLSLRHSMEHGGLCAYIDDLYVKPEFRRQGAGSAALAALRTESQARGCRAICVEAAESNAAAVSLYLKCGLRTITDGRVLLRANNLT